MKALIILGALAAMAGSCQIDKHIMSAEQLSHWNNQGDTILFDGKPVGRYDASMNEWELYRGRQTMEITIYCFEEDKAQGLINYVHTKHRKQKVEIKKEPKK